MTLFAFLLFLSPLDPPFPVFEGSKPTWGWEYPTNQPIDRFTMITNAVHAFDFGPGSFNVVGITNGTNGTNFKMVGKSPIALGSGGGLGTFLFYLRAVDTNNVESDNSNLVTILVDPIRLKIDSASPFKAKFDANAGYQYQVQGQAGIGATWSLLGNATEDPPLSGHFYFVDPEKRTNFIYRVVGQ